MFPSASPGQGWGAGSSPPGSSAPGGPRPCTDGKWYFATGLGICFVSKMLFSGEALFQGKDMSLKGGEENTGAAGSGASEVQTPGSRPWPLGHEGAGTPRAVR